MISALFDKHSGSAIDIVASGPSASAYRRQGPSIAVNGGILAPGQFDYFMCGDHRSHNYDWFRCDNANVRVIAKLVASQDHVLYPVLDDDSRVALPYHLAGSLKLPPPEPPHLIYDYKPFSLIRLNRRNRYLMFGGTISCCALQLAWIMGASSVNLYGCNFTHRHNNHYFYYSKQNGAVSQSQTSVMQSVIDKLRADMTINIIGESKLK